MLGLIIISYQLSTKVFISKLNFTKKQNYDGDKKILLYRMHVLKNKIDKTWLSQKLDTFKIKCKELFLK